MLSILNVRAGSYKVQVGVGRKKPEMGHHFCARVKGWSKKHGIHWGWVRNNYASINSRYVYRKNLTLKLTVLNVPL